MVYIIIGLSAVSGMAAGSFLERKFGTTLPTLLQSEMSKLQAYISTELAKIKL